MATSSRTRTSFKVVLVGDPKVGKTSLLLQIDRNRSQRLGSSTGAFSVHSSGVHLEIHELGNQDDGDRLHRADAVIVMYDLTNKDSFSSIRPQVERVRNNCQPDVKIFVVGGKSDLVERHRESVMPYDIEALAEELELEFYATSASTRDQIDKLVDDIALALTWREEENQSPTPDLTFEIVFLGNKEVGKSALIRRFVDKDFSGRNFPTQGADTRNRIINIGKCSVMVSIIEIPGHNSLRSNCLTHCRNATAAVIMYDMTNIQSFQDLPQWMDFIRKNCLKVKKIFLVGGKSDLCSSREGRHVSHQEAASFARTEGLNTFETSAKTGNGVDNLFKTIAARITRIQEEMRSQTTVTGKGIVVGDSGVGKTALIRAFQEKNIDFAKVSLGFDTVDLDIITQNQLVKFKFWDTIGQERFTPVLPNSYYRDAEVVIIMYDMTKRETFENVKKWLKIVRRKCFQNVAIFLVGGKSDMQVIPEISSSEAKAIANREGLQSFITSAKSRRGVQQLFASIADSLLSKNNVPSASTRQRPITPMNISEGPACEGSQGSGKGGSCC